MFLSPALDLPIQPSPITTSLFKSRSEEMAVGGPGPRWLGDTLRNSPTGSCYVDAQQLPALFIRRKPLGWYEAAGASRPMPPFQLRATNPVVLGVANALFAGARPLNTTEHDVLSRLADELAMTCSQSFIPGMR